LKYDNLHTNMPQIHCQDLSRYSILQSNIELPLGIDNYH